MQIIQERFNQHPEMPFVLSLRLFSFLLCLDIYIFESSN